MMKQTLDDRLTVHDEALSIALESTQSKLQQFRDTKIALDEVIRISKKTRNTKAFVEFLEKFKSGNETEDLNHVEEVSPVQLAPNVKMERASSESKKIPMEADPVDTGTSFVKAKISSVKEEPNLMPPPTLRPKRGRKKNADKVSLSTSESSTSTRSSTRTTRSNAARESDVVCTEPTLECVTLSDEESAKSDKDEAKKVMPVKRSTRLESIANNIKIEEMLPPPPVTRSTRTKRNQKKAEDVNNDTITVNQLVNETKLIIHNETFTTIAAPEIEQKKVNEAVYSNEIEDNRKENDYLKPDDRNKRLHSERQKMHTAKRPKKNKSADAAECNDSVQTTYEDAIDVPRESCKFKMNAVVVLENLIAPPNSTDGNETYIADKPASLEIENCGPSKSQANETVVISPKRVKSKETIVCDKNVPSEDFNGLDDIMTDDDTPPPTATKSKQIAPTTSSNKSIVMKAYENGSPVKKLVQVFEKMVKGGVGVGKDRVTPATARQMKNTTPTHQNNLYTANGTASKPSNIPLSATKTGSTSAIKRSQLEFQERELLRRQKEEEARKKREQHMQAQAEERRKRVEAQELKTLQVQQKKEMLKQQKLQHLDEVQRVKDEKARQVLQEKQEKIDKHKEQLEKKRQRFKKGGPDGSLCKPIYMTQATPLLMTTDCYDSDEENANIKSARVIPAWTMREQLHSTLRLMATVDDPSLRIGFYATKPNTPDLVDIFQDIDPVKLGRTSSAVWRKPPRYTLMHLPSFTEEAEPTY